VLCHTGFVNKVYMCIELQIIWLIFLMHAVDCRLYNISSAVPANGAAAAGGSNNGTASTASSTLPSQSGKDYDFSSLTQGFFSKR
jgi:hypothetical protein